MKTKLSRYFKNISEFIDDKIGMTTHWIDMRGESFLRTQVLFFCISLFISILIWIFVAWNGNTDGTRTISVPVQYSNLQRGYSMFDNTRTIDIKLVGRINSLSRVENSEITAQVNLQGLQPGKYSLPVNINVPSYVRVRSWDPSNVDLEIYRHVERSIPIKWRVDGDIKNGMIVSSVDIEPSEAVVSGPELEVLSVPSLEVVIPSDRVDDPAFIKLPISIANNSGDMHRVSITPVNANIKVSLEQEILGEKIPVKVSVIGQPAEGLEVESVKVIPDLVTIRGSSKAVQQMTSLLLPPVDISGLDQNLNLLLPLQPANLPSDIEITGPDRARVEITVRKKMSSKTFNNVGIMLEGGRQGSEWKISPQYVRVMVEGPKSAVDALSANSIPCELYVNVSNIVTKQLTLPVLVRNLKKDFRVLQIEPEQVVVTSVE